MRKAPVPLSRRAFLRGSGAALALPFLESTVRAASAAAAGPRRLVAIETNMGILPQYFFPESAGPDYPLSPYLETLKAFRDRFTVLSGVSLPGVTGGHAAEKCFLTGTPHPERGGFRNGVSLDQVAAEQVGDQTRFPSLVLAMSGESPTLSYTRSGAPLPADRSPRKVFERLFVQGRPDEVAAQVEALRQRRSMLDFVRDEAARLGSSISPEDRRRLDQYLTSVRELERRLQAAEAWEQKPKPKTEAKAPEEIGDSREFVAKTRLMFDVIKLALESDSTRVVTLFIDTTVIHNLTHHGNRPEALADLKAHELRQFDALRGFLAGLDSVKEGGASMLDLTQVLYGTCMGSANSHSNVNLPVLIAGGGFRHGRHLAFDTAKNAPLTNLYLSMLRRLGVEAESFSSSTGTLKGLDPA